MSDSESREITRILARVTSGEPRAAAEELGIAVGIRTRELGAGHPDTLRSELQYAMSLTESGRAPESIPLLEELRRRKARAYGEDDPRTLQASSQYAVALMSDSQHTAADEIFRETLDRQREILGPEHRDTIETSMGWSCSLNWRSRGAEGEELIQQRERKCDEAEALLRQGIERHARILGDEHPLTCSAKIGLGRCLPDSSEEKLRLWTEALEGLRASEGKATPTIFIISRDLAQLLLRHGRKEEGLHLLRRAVEDFGEKYGDEHQWTILNVGFLVNALRNHGEYAEALEVAKQRLDLRRSRAERPDADAWALNNYAWALLTSDFPELRDPRVALPLAERAVQLVGDDENAAPILDTLALALHMNRRNDEAIERQREALALLAEDDAGHRSDYVLQLVRYLASAGSETEARETIVAHVRDLHAASQTTTAFADAVEGFSNRLASRELHAQSEFARREALEIGRSERNDEIESLVSGNE